LPKSASAGIPGIQGYSTVKNSRPHTTQIDFNIGEDDDMDLLEDIDEEEIRAQCMDLMD
jgi:hypothetical protein